MSDIGHPREQYKIFSHDDVLSRLGGVIESDKVPHAWMFYGQKGVGKATTAYRFIRKLLSDGGAEAPPSFDMFGDLPAATDEPDDAPLSIDATSPVARMIEAQSHPDLLVLEGNVENKYTISVDDVREATKFLRLTSSGKWRVLLVDAAEDMNRSAANALLKVLEEPPANAIIILISHHPGLLLPTIRSRCSLVSFKPLDGENLEACLKNLTPETENFDLALELSGGSVATALDWLNPDYAELYNSLETLLQAPLTQRLRLGQKVAESLAKPAQLDQYHKFSELMLRMLQQSMRTDSPDTLAQDLAVWDKIQSNFQQADVANLDKKQAILQSLAAIG